MTHQLGYQLINVQGQNSLVDIDETDGEIPGVGDSAIHAHLHSDTRLKEAERYLVFCSGDNSVEEVCTIEYAHKVAQKKVAEWRGTGVFPWVTIARAQETYEVF